MGNLYFNLTQELNEGGPIAALASGRRLAERCLLRDPLATGDLTHGNAE
jgi:hypothetical protein